MTRRLLPRAGVGDAAARRRRRQAGVAPFTTDRPTRDLAPLLAWAAERDVELEGLSVTRPTLEDVYLELTA